MLGNDKQESEAKLNNPKNRKIFSNARQEYQKNFT